MAIRIECDCGKLLRLADAAAGKRIKCPICSKPVKVPSSDAMEITDFDDGFDDDFDDPFDDGFQKSARRGSRKQSSLKQKSRKRKQQKGTNFIVGAIIGAVTVVVIVAIPVGIWLFNSDDNELGVIAENPLDAQENGDPVAPMPDGNIPNPANDQIVQLPSKNNPHANGRLWAVLSNFKQARAGGVGAFNKSYTIDYRVVNGKASGQQVAIYLSEDSPGALQMYTTIPIDPKTSGSVSFQVGPGFGIAGSIKANLAVKDGSGEWEAISEKISIGGAQTSATVPKTIAEQAGASANGKLIVLGNGRKENSFGQTAYVVDFVLQEQLGGGFYFFVFKDSRGEAFEIQASSQLRFAKRTRLEADRSESVVFQGL
ncbi:MAG: hypothetical protein CMJ78_16580 [Planctomycetaceae bacterium]|nr:hypothetical protein [Planctomycetaceae bacterium]